MKKFGFCAAILISGVFIYPTITLGSIWLRLHRNQPAAESIAAALAARYPAYRIVGAASYESEVIYISVSGQPDKATQIKMRDWLADVKVRRQITARGLVRFHNTNAAGENELGF